MAAAETPLIEARGIAKSFGGVEVLHGVDLGLAGGEVHALLGENGAGKSTFARILAGVHRPSRGEIRLAGAAIELSSPLEAQRRGIVLLHQEPISFPDLSVAENLSIGRRREGPLARMRWGVMVEEARALMATLDVEIDVTRPMRGLSIADQQMVEIARAVAGDSRLIIMDEPTAALTPREVETLFTIVRRLRAGGRALVFISHRLEEVRAIADRVTVFRDGAKVATAPAAELADDDIIRLMIGRPLRDYLRREASGTGAVALAVSGLTLPGRFSDIAFEVRRGQIVGIGGLVGAGRSDVARAIFGIAPATSGTHRHQGQGRDDRLAARRHPPWARLCAGGPCRRRHLPHPRLRHQHHRCGTEAVRAARRHPATARAQHRRLGGRTAQDPPRLDPPAGRRIVRRQPAEDDPGALAPRPIPTSSSSTSRRAASTSASRPSSTPSSTRWRPRGRRSS